MRFLPIYIHLALLAVFVSALFYSLKQNYFFTFSYPDRYKRLIRSVCMLISALSCMAMLVLYAFPSFAQTEPGFLFLFDLILFYCFFWIPSGIFSLFLLLKAKIRNNAHILLLTGRFLSFLFIALILYGLLWGRKAYEITQTEIPSSKLPLSFDGFRIVQLSDYHLGSLGKDTAEVSTLVRIVNSLHPDLICFTGDMVNCRAEELRPFVPIFKRLKSFCGAYSILGNHDFGKFYPWNNNEERLADDRLMVELQTQAGFKLMLDEHCAIKRGSDSIALIGIQNWSKPPFPSRGDFEKASKGTDGFAFKILLSHDPTHWLLKISGKKDVDLTLSGHTHGGQVGFSWNNKKYSPATFKFPYCGGLYKQGGQFLYVNVGLGYVGLPVRIGMRPEIGLIILKHK